MGKKSLHYVHRITFDGKDILPYKAILIYDQISLIDPESQFRPALESLLNIEPVQKDLS
jgi:hypothetical protein